VLETYCDITPLLEDAPKGNSEAAVKVVGDEDTISDIMMSEDDDVDEVGKEFEVIEYEVVSEHNGTIRRWYRGFRH
jgi:hypothetical protein